MFQYDYNMDSGKYSMKTNPKKSAMQYLSDLRYWKQNIFDILFVIVE